MKTYRLFYIIVLCVSCVAFASCFSIIGAVVGGDMGERIGSCFDDMFIGGPSSSYGSGSSKTTMKSQSYQSSKKTGKEVSGKYSSPNKQKEREANLKKNAEFIHNPFVLTDSHVEQIYTLSFEEDATYYYRTYSVSDITGIIRDERNVVYKAQQYDSYDSYKKGVALGHGLRDVAFRQDTMCFYMAPIMNVGAYESGFSFKIPPSLNVGDTIETGVLKQMHNGVANFITFSDFSVQAEEDVMTRTDTLHCYRIGGRIDGKIGETLPRPFIDSAAYTIWLAPEVGLVKVQTDYLKMTFVLDSIIHRK